jgi:hypothetical protein
MIPYLATLFGFTALSYFTLKNKWLSLITFGTFSFVSIIIMGQVEIFCILFIMLSMATLLKAFSEKNHILLSFISAAFLGISAQFVPFGALLLPIFLLFIWQLLENKNYSFLQIIIYEGLSILIFLVSFIIFWLPKISLLSSIKSNGESQILFNLQISPINLPPYHTISIWLLGYLLIIYILIIDMRKNGKNILNGPKYFSFYCFAIFAWFFTTVYTNPQWWLLLLPPILYLLDNFRNWLNYLFTIVLLSLFIFYPMMFVNNVDLTLVNYLPTITLTQNASTILITFIITLLVVWIIELKQELNGGGIAPITMDIKDDTKSIDKEFIMNVASPLLIMVVPFVLCFIIGYSAISLLGCETNGGIYANQPIGQIYGTYTAGQTFISQYNGLNGVEVFMATYGHNTAGSDLIFHLRSSPDSVDIRTVTVNGTMISDNTYYSFNFAPIPDSINKQYYFSIESPGADQSDPVTIWSSSNDVYTDGTAYYNGQPQNDDLAFRMHYKPTIRDILSFIGKKYPELTIGG